MAIVGLAPCQCFSFGSNQTTSPGRISSTGPPHFCTLPTPDVTISVCPSGCVCQAVRAPGSKVTLAPRARAGSAASKSGSTRTVPVKYSAGPFPEGREPHLLISMMNLLDVALGLQKRLDRATLVHGAVTFRHLCQRQRQIEDLAGIDRSILDEIDQLRQETAHRRGAAVQVNVGEEQLLPVQFHTVRNSDIGNVSAGAGRMDGLHHRLLRADALS